MEKIRLGAKYLIDDMIPYDDHVHELVLNQVTRGVSDEIINLITYAKNPIIFYPIKETVCEEYEKNGVVVSAFCNVAEVCQCKDCVYSDEHCFCEITRAYKTGNGFCDEGIPCAHIEPEESEASFTISDAREMLKRE